MLAGRKTDGEIVNGASGVKTRAGEKVLPKAILPTSVIFNSRPKPRECVNMGYCTACAQAFTGGTEKYALHANVLRSKSAAHGGKLMWKTSSWRR